MKTASCKSVGFYQLEKNSPPKTIHHATLNPAGCQEPSRKLHQPANSLNPLSWVQKLHRSLSRSFNWIQHIHKKSALKLPVSQGWNKELTKVPQESFSTAPILTSHTFFHTFQAQSLEAQGSKDSGPLPNDLLRIGWAPPITAIQPHWTHSPF